MKRKFLSTLLFGALACTTLSTVTSCKDYDDDINSLQNQIDALSKKIDDINSQISAGSVITSVTPTANGVTVTLSNGKSYDLTNGKDGKDGTAWTISEDGYWVKDGVKTDYKALGKDGKDGEAGKPGADGKPGENGKDGIYFVPNTETGCFDKCDATGKVIEQTNISWKLSAVTGVMDNDVLTLYGIPDKNGVVNEKGIQISLSNNLRGFTFAGDKLVNGEYVLSMLKDGVPGIRIADFEFAAQKLENADKKTEMTKAVGGKNANGWNGNDSIRNATYAYYMVSPSNAKWEDLQNLNYVVKADAPIVSRADEKGPSKDLAVQAKAVEFKDGILKVQVLSTGEPSAWDETISLVALQATKENSETVTEQTWNGLYKKNIKTLALANKKLYAKTPSEDYHFRNASVGINGSDSEAGAAVKGKAVWSTQDGKDIDIELTVGETIDLNNYVDVHEKADPCGPFNFEDLNLGIKYEVVKNYTIGNQETPQEEFVSLSGSQLTSKVYDTTGAAAIGRTPIIRATLYNKANNRIVTVAYIKVKIVKESVADKELTVIPQDKDKGEFIFNCESSTLSTTTEQFNKEIYNVVGLGREDFHNLYSKFEGNNPTPDEDGKVTPVKGEVGTVTESTDTKNGETTHKLTWTLTADEMWANAGKEVIHTVYYKSAASNNVKIVLKAKVTGIEHAKDFKDADHIAEYWKADKAQFNVAVPTSTKDDDAGNCVFKNDLNSVFYTKEGKLNLGTGVTYTYSFCKDNEKVTNVGEYKVKFEVADNGLTLKAAIKKGGSVKEDIASQTVAKITNDADATKVPYNYVELEKSEVAKMLLNTGAFNVMYSVSAKACDDAKKEVKVTFSGLDHFTATFIQPVVIAAKAADKFIDGVDFGEKGSFVKLEDLIAPSDWRGRAFSDYTNYWKYYGVEKITVDNSSVKCDLNHSSEKIDLPATIELKQTAKDEDGTVNKFITGYEKDKDGNVDETKPIYAKTNYGFLTYKNNGSTVNEDFNLYVKVTVEYKWGTIATDYITVPVAKTIKK